MLTPKAERSAQATDGGCFPKVQMQFPQAEKPLTGSPSCFCCKNSASLDFCQAY